MFFKYTLSVCLIFAAMLPSFGQLTQLKPAFCPTTVPSLGTNIRCNGVAGAEGYLSLIHI